MCRAAALGRRVFQGRRQAEIDRFPLRGTAEAPDPKMQIGVPPSLEVVSVTAGIGSSDEMCRNSTLTLFGFHTDVTVNFF